MIAKKLALDEAVDTLAEGEGEFSKGTAELGFHKYEALPLDNLDRNIRCGDALFEKWPDVSAIVGNPPYQSKNKAQQELEPGYLQKLRAAYPSIDGRADYCVYWFRKAHDMLDDGERAGLVGTNTIRQNYTREAGLDYIVQNGGTITSAVNSMIWPGDAVVHVSIVNWIKGASPGKKRIYIQEGNEQQKGWRHADFDRIGASLSFALDVTTAKIIKKNSDAGCFQGQTHGHEGFLIPASGAVGLIKAKKALSTVLRPFLIGDDLIGSLTPAPSRFVIDFRGLDITAAQRYPDQLRTVKNAVLPDRQKAALKEAERNKAILAAVPNANVNKHHENFLKYWWRLSYARDDMFLSILKLKRYIVCVRVTKRPIFEFVSSQINPNDSLQVFGFDDDYSFGILQSSIHWSWFSERCSTMKSDPRYTSNSVFDTFGWPQNPTAAAVAKVAKAAVALRACRDAIRVKRKQSLREMYRTLELPGAHPLKDAQQMLDMAVREAYGMSKKADPLASLLALNHELAAAEKAGKPVQGPGLPAIVKKRAPFVTTDCVSP